jgi:hypothetical protein
MVNLPMTSLVELRGHRMAIAACFVFQREISSSVLWDFFDSIGQTETNWHVRVTSGFTPITDINLRQIARQAARRPDLTGRISRL